MFAVSSMDVYSIHGIEYVRSIINQLDFLEIKQIGRRIYLWHSDYTKDLA